MVKHAETLRKIQTELGLTGSFKGQPIANWLMKHNTTDTEYQQVSSISASLESIF